MIPSDEPKSQEKILSEALVRAERRYQDLQENFHNVMYEIVIILLRTPGLYEGKLKYLLERIMKFFGEGEFVAFSIGMSSYARNITGGIKYTLPDRETLEIVMEFLTLTKDEEVEEDES